MDNPQNLEARHSFSISKSRELYYDDELLKPLLTRHPKLIKKIMSVIPQLDTTGDSFTDEEFSIQLGEFVPLDDIGQSYVYSVAVDGQKFFLKIYDNDMAQDHGGTKEIASFKEAVSLLQKVPGVEVIRFHLGYSDKWGNNFFVSEWRDLELLDKYLGNPEILGKNKIKELIARYESVNSILTAHGYIDVDTSNAFYDPATDAIVFFDLYTKDASIK